jgi:predicted membrane protein
MEKDRWDKEQWDREFRDDLGGSIRDDIRDDVRSRVRDRIHDRAHRHHGMHGGSGVIAGAVIVGVGLILLLDNMGILHADNLWRYWPVILIAVGAGRVMESHRPAALVWGGMISLIGLLFLLDNLHILSFSFNMIWPLAVIAFGVSMLLRSAERTRMVGDTGFASNPTLSLWTVFGGGRRRITSDNFQGGEVFAIFGGFHIDLRGSQITSGRAVVEINSIFGGVEMIVPENWRVSVRGTGIFGAFEDKTIPPRPDVGVTPPELIVTGSAVFGGATVRN